MYKTKKNAFWEISFSGSQKCSYFSSDARMMLLSKSRPVGAGGTGGAMKPPDFVKSVNPISPRVADYAHQVTNCSPGFSDLPTSLKSRR